MSLRNTPASTLRNAVDVEAQTLLGALKIMLVDNKNTQNLLSEEGPIIREGGAPRGFHGSFNRRGRPESPQARKYLGIDTPTFQRLRSGASDSGSMTPSDIGSEHDERRAKSGYPKQRRGVALYSPAKHVFDSRDKILEWRRGNAGGSYAEDDRKHSRSPEPIKQRSPHDQFGGSSLVVGHDPSSCRGVEVHLLNISSMLARIEDCLTPIRREVEEVKNTVQNGGMECHHPSCTKCAGRKAHAGRGWGKEADMHKDKSDTSSLSVLSQHAKNLEMQLLHLQAENAGYREQQQLQQVQQQAPPAQPAPLQRPTPRRQDVRQQTAQLHNGGTSAAPIHPASSSEMVGSDWPQLDLQESNPNTPREPLPPLETTRSVSQPPPRWFGPAANSDGNDKVSVRFCPFRQRSSSPCARSCLGAGALINKALYSLEYCTSCINVVTRKQCAGVPGPQEQHEHCRSSNREGYRRIISSGQFTTDVTSRWAIGDKCSAAAAAAAPSAEELAAPAPVSATSAAAYIPECNNSARTCETCVPATG